MAKQLVGKKKRYNKNNKRHYPWFEYNEVIQRLMLNDDEMREFDFQKWDKNWDFIFTPKYNKNVNKYALLSIDCEMVGTKRGSEIARVSLVDIDLNVIYDEYVLPTSKVIDYRTKWSGITKKILDNCTLTFDDCIHDICGLIDQYTVLVGHHLTQDLRALKLVHYNIMDTQVLYMGYNRKKDKYYRVSLKNLAKMYLNKDIQNSKRGHSSVEDARITMELMLLEFDAEMKRTKKSRAVHSQDIPYSTNGVIY